MSKKSKKGGSPKAVSMKNINVGKLLIIIYRFLTSKRSIFLTLVFITTIVFIKRFLEVLSISYLTEIALAVSESRFDDCKREYKFYLTIVVSYTFLYALTLYVAIPLIRQVHSELGVEQIAKIFQLSHQDFRKTEVSYYISNINRSSTAVSDFLENVFVKLLGIVASILFTAIKIYQMFGISISLVFSGVMLSYFVSTYFFTLVRIKYHIKSIDAENILQNQLLEKLQNRDSVLMLDMVDAELNNLDKNFRTYQKNTIDFARSLPVLDLLQDLIFFTFYFILMYFRIQKDVPVTNKSDFFSAFNILLAANKHCSILGYIFRSLYKAAANVTAGYLLLDVKRKVGHESGNIKKIEFKNYSGQIFKNMNLYISKMGTYAIVGPNGAGKSTIVKSIMGFYNEKENIFINGLPLEDINLKTYQRRFVYATQDCQLFQGSILYNLKYGNKRSQEEIFNLCRELEIEQFILKKEGGYNYEIGINGTNLSGGERQKLVIARSILRNADVYIFDEPTANIDERSELFLLKKINELLKDKIVLYIIHNLKLVCLFDRAIYINNSVVSVPKPYSELMESDEEFIMFMRNHSVV